MRTEWGVFVAFVLLISYNLSTGSAKPSTQERRIQMTKFCPFMSTNPSILEKEQPLKYTVYCTENCALYVDKHCSIRVLAQKAIRDFEKEGKEKSVSE